MACWRERKRPAATTRSTIDAAPGDDHRRQADGRPHTPLSEARPPALALVSMSEHPRPPSPPQCPSRLSRSGATDRERERQERGLCGHAPRRLACCNPLSLRFPAPRAPLARSLSPRRSPVDHWVNHPRLCESVVVSGWGGFAGTGQSSQRDAPASSSTSSNGKRPAMPFASFRFVSSYRRVLLPFS